MLWHFRAGTRSLRAQRFEGHAGAVHALAHDPVSNLAASGSADRTVRLWRANADASCVAVIRAHAAVVRGVCFAGGGARLLTCSDDKSVKAS